VNRPKITTLIFDLGNVFVHVDSQLPIRWLENKFPHVSVSAIRKSVFHSDLYYQYERGLTDNKRFFESVGSLVGDGSTIEGFQEVWRSMLTPNQPMIDLLPLLSSQYQLVLLSNTNELHVDYIAKTFSIFNHFDHLIFSCDVGCIKPNEAIYQIALKQSGSSASESVFIDDLPDNVQTAVNLGMKGVCFRDYESFLEDLDSMAFGESDSSIFRELKATLKLGMKKT